MKVSSTIKTYPESGEETTQPKEIEVRSHWNYQDRVHLVFGPEESQTRITVLAGDLQRAIANATNHR